MKIMKRISLLAALAVTVACSIPCFSINRTQAATDLTVTTATGYTSASDVDYVKKGDYVVNWGVREENCTFLSTYAQSFYTGNYTYDVLSQNSGGSSQSNAPQSALYSALQSMMKEEHDYINSYDATKTMFCCTDCEGNNYSNISSFYSGKSISGTWNGSWNREHTWPNSKGDLAGSGENDIMMLRPTATSENGSRGNKAYGESSSYYNPNTESNGEHDLRGDCARIVLYQYVRWGCINTGSKYNSTDIYGTKGVIESLSVLLEWMEEDPVDTWEMGRNDAVQSITGTRNVFVDYPEYAWLLFGRSIPAGMTTPSGIADGEENSDSSSGSSSSENSSSFESSSPEDSSSSESNSSSGNSSSSGESDSSSGESDEESEENGCVHEYGQWFVIQPATESAEGYQVRFCSLCGKQEKDTLEKLENRGCAGTVGIAAGASVLLGACALILIKKEKNGR